MTKPTVIFFGPDMDGSLQVYLRTLLFSTSQKGQILESMYVKLKRGESVQNFNIWVYGGKSFVRGSGLFVGKEGVTYSHHFLLPKDGTSYEFLAGTYNLEVYASRLNSRTPLMICSLQLSISKEDAEVLKEKSQDAGIYFDWGPDSQTYHSFVDLRPGTM